MDSNELMEQRKTALEDALLELLKERPYSQITVQDLIRDLGLSRKTFYRLFPCRDACLESLIYRFVLNNHCYVNQRMTEPADLLQSYIHHLNYWKENRFFLEIIDRNRLTPFLMKHALAHVQREEKHIVSLLNSPDMKCDEDILLFFIAGVNTMVMYWVRCGCRTPVEELAQKLVRLIHSPLLKEP